jgi:hypothetical protein
MGEDVTAEQTYRFAVALYQARQVDKEAATLIAEAARAGFGLNQPQRYNAPD